MTQKILTYLLLAFFTIFTIGCATVPLSDAPISSSLHSLGKVEAKKFPEVRLVTIGGDQNKGKILSLEGDTVTFSPFPYWNVEPLRIGLDEIHSIEMTEKKSAAGLGFLHGFGWVTLAGGILGAINSKYDVDYQNAMWEAPGIGLFGGLLGLAIGGITDLATRTKYDLSKLSKDKKIQTLMAIMGL